MAEKEYIEREALKERLGVSPLFGNIRDGGFFIKDGVIDLVDRQPADDVVEVRHGEWLPDYEIFVYEPFDTTPHRTQTGWKCSLCGRVECAKEPYCHCGAKMDGKGEG
jgi:hypothetical protein